MLNSSFSLLRELDFGHDDLENRHSDDGSSNMIDIISRRHRYSGDATLSLLLLRNGDVEPN